MASATATICLQDGNSTSCGRLPPDIRRTGKRRSFFKKTLELARVDELTGLASLPCADRELEERSAEGAYRQGFFFIMIDVDDFKRINRPLWPY